MLHYGWWACRNERDRQQFCLLSNEESTARPIVQAGRETGTEAVSQQLPMDYRQIGQALASHLNRSSGVPTGAALQGMIADLAADHPELLLPMRDLVSRPAFQLLIAKADSGGGMLQRDALINEVRPLFSGQVLDALLELLNGFLNLPSASNQDQNPPANEDWTGDRPTKSPRPSTYSSTRAHPQDLAGGTAADPPAAGRSQGMLWILALAVAGLVAGAGATLRSPAFCGYVGLCADSKGLENPDQILVAARQAEQSLRRASSLTDYKAALEQLDDQLLRLRNEPLSRAQKQQREELSASSRQAQTVLIAEQAEQQRIEKAAAALQAAQQQGGADSRAQLVVASQELAAIPPRSFAATEASRLRKQLDQLEQASRAAETQPVRSPVKARSMPNSPERPQDASPETAPYREQPLF